MGVGPPVSLIFFRLLCGAPFTFLDVVHPLSIALLLLGWATVLYLK